MIVSDPDWVYLGKDGSDITMNNYFVEHPEQIVGKMEMVSGPYGMESTCTADDSQPFEEQLQESLQNINGEFDAIDPEEILTEDLEELLLQIRTSKIIALRLLERKFITGKILLCVLLTFRPQQKSGSRE